MDRSDIDRLGRWMDTQELPGTGEAVECTAISGGSQNEIFGIRRGGLHCALRKPPKDAPAGRDDGILREWRIIEALGGSDVPHTEAVAVCTDTSVLGCTFYLMGFVDGWSPMGLDGLAEPVRRRPRCSPRARLPTRRRDRTLVQGRLAGQRASATSADPMASTSARSSVGSGSTTG